MKEEKKKKLLKEFEF